MSIVTEALRIKTAKDNLKVAIEEKGVSVGDGTIDTYPDKVRAISAGGGGDYHDCAWDGLQINGTRTRYDYFADGAPHNGWFRPKYDIRPGSAQAFMRNYAMELKNKPAEHPDLTSLLEELGVTMDFSLCTNFQYVFYGACLSRIPTLDFTGITVDTGINYLLFGSYIKIIDKIIVKENHIMTNSFNYTNSLVEVRFEGVIGRNITLSAAFKLSAASAKSAILCLKDYSGTADEYIYTISFHADTWALLNAEGNASPTGTTWAEYVSSLGWNK